MSAEVVNKGEWTRPTPDPDGEGVPYFEACARGELLVQECPECGHRQHYPRAWCVECGATPGWLTTEGVGTVHTFTIMHQYGAEPFKSELPYAVVIVELPEGPRLMGNLTDCDPADVHIGMPVEVYMVSAAENVAVPFWRPRRADAG
jgi:uncharacterized OB-fold protein